MPFKRGGVSWAGRVRAGRAAVNRPDLSHVPDEPVTAAPTPTLLEDWPAIRRQHARWWQVYRIELHGHERHKVLIAECEKESEAFAIVLGQAHQCMIAKWNDRRPPYFSHRDPLVVTGGPSR